jgi:hypothetical protein
MKNLITTLAAIVLFVLAGTLTAQNEKFSGALLWKVSGNGLDRKSTRLNSSHCT